MAIDPRISLATQTLDTNQLFKQNLANLQAQDNLIFNREINPLRLAQAQRANELAQAQQPLALQQAENAKQQALIQGVGGFARQALLLKDPVQIAEKAKLAAQKASEIGLDGSLFMNIHNFALQNPDKLEQELQDTIEESQQLLGNQSKAQFGTKTITVRDENGDLFLATQKREQNRVSTVFSPISGDPNKQPVGKVQFVDEKGLTPQEAEKLKVETFGTKEEQKLKAKRASELKATLGEQNRNAARAEVQLGDAIRILEKADFSTGLTASIKNQLARVFPDIDVSDIGVLDQKFKELALQALQAFKGPTTNFEYRVAQSVAGGISDPKTANLARLKSLQRARYFTQEEFRQFKEWTKQGKDPDEFAFDFDKTIKTKKGDISLRQLRDIAASRNLTIEEVLKKLNE